LDFAGSQELFTTKAPRHKVKPRESLPFLVPSCLGGEKIFSEGFGDSMKRVHQAVLILSTLVGSWLGMQDVHELGHVLAAWLTGGRVAKVVLDPLTISRTDLAENPRPLIVTWGGPILGVFLPLALWLIVSLAPRGRGIKGEGVTSPSPRIASAPAVSAGAADAGKTREGPGVRGPNVAEARRAGLPGTFVLRFFAGFCLIANGCYLGAGSFTHIGDAGEMLKHGSASWHLWLFAALTVPTGLSLWHNLGPDFGLGKPCGAVDRRVAYATLACALALVALGFAVGS
jgi:Peptidase M50B-like